MAWDTSGDKAVWIPDAISATPVSQGNYDQLVAGGQATPAAGDSTAGVVDAQTVANQKAVEEDAKLHPEKYQDSGWGAFFGALAVAAAPFAIGAMTGTLGEGGLGAFAGTDAAGAAGATGATTGAATTGAATAAGTGAAADMGAGTGLTAGSTIGLAAPAAPTVAGMGGTGLTTAAAGGGTLAAGGVVAPDFAASLLAPGLTGAGTAGLISGAMNPASQNYSILGAPDTPAAAATPTTTAAGGNQAAAQLGAKLSAGDLGDLGGIGGAAGSDVAAATITGDVASGGLLTQALAWAKANPQLATGIVTTLGGLLKGIGDAQSASDLLDKQLALKEALQQWQRQFVQSGSYWDAKINMRPAASKKPLTRPGGAPVYGQGGLISQAMQ